MDENKEWGNRWVSVGRSEEKKKKRREIIKNEIMGTIEDALEEIECGYDVRHNLDKIRQCTWTYENLLLKEG